MLPRITAVYKQALLTFSGTRDLFYQNLKLLRALMHEVKKEDVKLDPKYLSKDIWEEPSKAPVTYMDIFENNMVSIGVFILKPGMRLPLHNHPEMYGLIKVLAGKLKITSYSLSTEKVSEIYEKNGGENPKYSFLHPLVIAECDGEEIVNVHSEPCLLEPQNRNLHEIESVDGPAAFLDVLAPPYGTEISNVGPRNCSYYSKLGQIAPKVYRLAEISSPSWYWTDTTPYCGPQLLESAEQVN